MAAKNAANWTTTRDVASGDVANEDVAWQTYVGHRLHSAKSCCQLPLPLLLLPVATCPAGLSDGLPHYNANRQNADRRARARHSHSQRAEEKIFATVCPTCYYVVHTMEIVRKLPHTHTLTHLTARTLWNMGDGVCVCVPCQLG